MMAIVGEPSADGLVMEPIELRFGPLATPLPGGLVADVTLDGDVVAESAVRALLGRGDGGPASGTDWLSPVACVAALAAAAEAAEGRPVSPEHRWQRVAAVELERALSHLAWL